MNRHFMTNLLQKTMLVVAAAFLGVSSFVSPALAQAQQNTDLYYYTQNGIIFYENGALHCGGTGAAISGGAAGMLQKQKNLDPKWIPAILAAASQAQTDPIAMASLMFWEHRGFPKYGEGPQSGESDSVGRGPWQITRNSWPAGAGDYMTGVYDPKTATEVAATIVKNYGGKAGITLGSIDQDFGKGVNLPTVATLAKNYNAGVFTWRVPSVAGYKAGGRSWQNSSGAWGGQKQAIIDDYIIAVTYAYYLIATGNALGNVNTADFVQKGLENAAKIKDFKIGDAGSTGSIDEVCADAGGGSGDVAAKARGLAWPNYATHAHDKDKSSATPAYQDAMPKAQGGDPGNDAWSDCGVFVATVMIASGADPKYEKRGTGEQASYVRANSNPSDNNRKYDLFTNLTNKSQLKPGDIFIVNGIRVDHTFIYTGDYKGDDNQMYDSAGASWTQHVPIANHVYFDQGGYHFIVARPRTTNTAAQTATGQ